jgi:hypothetical protein
MKWGQESELSNLIDISYAEKHQTRKKVKNGQKLPRTAEILQAHFYDCTGLSEVITFECLTRFDSLFLLYMTVLDLYLDILTLD